ncbi:MAG: arylsulfatase [Pseudomonas sp.]
MLKILAVSLALWCGAALAESRPNILLIMADDLGFSDLGSYGGEIDTPNLDELAEQGLRMSSFYTAPTCSPTRSMVMTGTDNHLVGLGTMQEVLPFLPALQGRPGYEGHLNGRGHSLAALLGEAGYNTYLSGKWHLGRAAEQDPLQLGFDRAFALLDGGASHFQPVPGSQVRVEQPTYREDGRTVEVEGEFFSSDFYTDKLIGYLEEGRANGKPFFAWAAYTAPHWPLHAPAEYIDKYQGRYDVGYQVIRERRLARLRDSGLFPHGLSVAQPAEAPNPLWDQLNAQERALQARKMEVYAAMVEHMDMNIGRLIDYLKRSDQYDNTLILFVSDNGAAGEDHARGYSPGDALTDDSLANIGRRGSNINYGFRWAEVSATPFSLVKGTTGEGGISSPAIVKLPAGLRGVAGGQIVHGIGRVDDLLPTFLELAGAADPGDQHGGELRQPITGISLLPAWQGQSLQRSRPLAGEMFGQGYIRINDWKLRAASAPDGSPASLSAARQWQLFNLKQDRGETRDLSGELPHKVTKLKQAWEEYARWAGLPETD